MSQIVPWRCCYSVSAPSGAIHPVETQTDSFDFEAFFHAHYERIARVIARVVGDRGRAEDLAAEALWKLWQTPRLMATPPPAGSTAQRCAWD